MGSAGVFVGLAGCSSSNKAETTEPPETDMPTDTPTDTPTETPTETESATGTVSIIHDTHLQGRYGELDNAENIANYIGLMDQLNEEYPNALRLGVGDDLASSVLSSVFDGKHIVDALNAGSLDYDGFGNHDFDMGPDTFREQVANSDFPWLSANTIDGETGEVFAKEEGAKKYVLTEVDGITVGLTGILTEETPNVATVGNAEVLEPAPALQEVVPQMREEGADVVVVLSHVASPVVEEEVAPKVDGVDAYVGDHAALAYETPKVVNGSLVSIIGDEFKYLAELHLEVEDGEVVSHEFTRHSLAEEVERGLEPNPEVADLMRSYRDRLEEEVGAEIGRTETTLDAREKVVRREESNLGNYVAEKMRNHLDADVDVALMNGGGIRTDSQYEPGTLTQRDIVNIFPFGNRLTVLEVTGETLLATLENGVSEVERLSGRFPQVAGMEYTYDMNNEVGDRITEVTVNGEAIDPDATYSLATNNFVSGGGDGYEMLADVPRILKPVNGPLLSSLLIRRIEAETPIAPERDGRITINNATWETIVSKKVPLLA
ncbi:bifunctional metallophosphatase/5'-nucleotidase [Halorhabdus rudnickae]|uniref:bifunctional metallophosphatase/5'-nucleotidase n=1 Tax=Halorhabdus rudnickae TaxID=1775544 RepID=UPI00108236B6|nr:5'-nucleotidase C-terminal domain-containing protein [Halorhabdus rudnickae]